MKFLHNLREIIWPLLDPIDKNTLAKEISLEDITTDEENLDKALDYAFKYYEEEEKRNDKIDSKSTVFIGSFGITTTIIIAVLKDAINPTSFSNPRSVIFLVWLLLILIYLYRTLWFSVKAFERRNFTNLKYKDFIQKNDVEYKKHLIKSLINYTRNNQNVVNRKVGCMAMAHAYFKNVIWIAAFFPTVIFIYIVKSSHILLIITKLNNILGQIQLNVWFFFIFIIWLIVNTIISIKAWKLCKKNGHRDHFEC